VGRGGGGVWVSREGTQGSGEPERLPAVGCWKLCGNPLKLGGE